MFVGLFSFSTLTLTNYISYDINKHVNCKCHNKLIKCLFSFIFFFFLLCSAFHKMLNNIITYIIAVWIDNNRIVKPLVLMPMHCTVIPTKFTFEILYSWLNDCFHPFENHFKHQLDSLTVYFALVCDVVLHNKRAEAKRIVPG